MEILQNDCINFFTYFINKENNIIENKNNILNYIIIAAKNHAYDCIKYILSVPNQQDIYSVELQSKIYTALNVASKHHYYNNHHEYNKYEHIIEILINYLQHDNINKFLNSLSKNDDDSINYKLYVYHCEKIINNYVDIAY